MYEVSFAAADDGLCASRAAASYLVSTESEAAADVARLRAKGLEADYTRFAWSEALHPEAAGGSR